MTLKLPFLRSATSHRPTPGTGVRALAETPGAAPVQIQVHIQVQAPARFRAPPLDIRPSIPKTGHFPAATVTRVQAR